MWLIKRITKIMERMGKKEIDTQPTEYLTEKQAMEELQKMTKKQLVHWIVHCQKAIQRLKNEALKKDAFVRNIRRRTKYMQRQLTYILNFPYATPSSGRRVVAKKEGEREKNGRFRKVENKDGDDSKHESGRSDQPDKGKEGRTENRPREEREPEVQSTCSGSDIGPSQVSNSTDGTSPERPARNTGDSQ